MKTQAIGVSHTGTASCCLWVDEQYGYALSIVRPLRCREMRIVLNFAGRHLLPNQNDILKQFTVWFGDRVEKTILKFQLCHGTVAF